MGSELQLLSSINDKLTALIVLLVIFLTVALLSLTVNFRRIARQKMADFRNEYYSDLFISGEYQKALDQLDAALDKRPNDVQMMWYKGKALFQLERYEEASDVFHAIQSKEPDWSESAQRFIDRIGSRTDA